MLPEFQLFSKQFFKNSSEASTFCDEFVERRPELVANLSFEVYKFREGDRDDDFDAIDEQNIQMDCQMLPGNVIKSRKYPVIGLSKRTREFVQEFYALDFMNGKRMYSED